MATNESSDGSTRLIDSIEDAEQVTLESVRKFVDTVNDAFPDLGGGPEGPRRQIIDAAFRMTEHLVGASNRLAQNVLDIAERRLDEAKEPAS